MTLDEGKDKVAKLCHYFSTNRRVFFGPSVNEAQVRLSLIDPFFEALGWDVGNKLMNAPQYREVLPEDSLEIEGHAKAPDYTFRVGTTRKFYAEAKKCAVNLGADPAPAFQLRRYGFSGKLPLSILTNFGELGIYDCTARPHLNDKASRSRIDYFHADEYPDRWRELWEVFSRDAVWSGAFDQYADSKRKRGTSEVDSEFLKEMESWREALARNIALRNGGISPDDLNTAVQLTIDRVVFLRMAEDRALEPYEQLLNLSEGTDIYRRFMHDLCRRADEKYNSGLFHFQKESGVSEQPDRITPKLALDDKVFKPIIQSLYFRYGSPYAFAVMPVEILGTIYERFLGNVIRLTAGHQAKVEEKPEVRKAGGVYYTPSFIVEYIVKETIDRHIGERSPAQLAGAKSKPPFRILDMACGSGSFLLGAYLHLLDYCLKWYTTHRPEGFNKAVYQDPRNGEWRLTIEEKKRILTTHIFGVDIDRQAVEVTKLSLLLEVLEGETDQSLSLSQLQFGDRALPNLADNIKSGNSLIEPDDFHQGTLFGDKDEKRVNAFPWKIEFPEIIKAGGFDAVIGNPPYIRVQTLQEWAPAEVEFYKGRYTAASAGNYDTYVVFVEKGLSLIKKSGKLGFILPHKFFNAKYGEPLRTLIAKGSYLSEIVHFGDQQVFEGATNYTCLLFLDKSGAATFRFVKVDDLNAWRKDGTASAEGTIPAARATASEWNFTVGKSATLFDRLRRMPVKLENVTSRIFQGIKTSADKIYIVDEVRRKPTHVQVYSHEKDREYWLEPGLLHPLVKGGDSKRYHLARTNRLILFPYGPVSGGPTGLISEKVLKADYPLTWTYLSDNRRYLENRENGRMRGPGWYGYIYPKALDVMPLPKVFTPDIAARASFSLDLDGEAFFTGGVAGGYGILVLPEFSREYVLGLLNSRLLEWYVRQTASQMRGGYYSYESRFIRSLPVRTIHSEPDDLDRQVKMVDLVKLLLDLYQRLADAKSEAQKTVLQRQIDSAEAAIDRVVYELYELTADEIAVVEAGTSRGSEK